MVRQIDWIDTVWPGRRTVAGEYPQVDRAVNSLNITLFTCHEHSQVQYYCLMSVAGSWIDFHIDFGGTSVSRPGVPNTPAQLY